MWSSAPSAAQVVVPATAPQHDDIGWLERERERVSERRERLLKLEELEDEDRQSSAGFRSVGVRGEVGCEGLW